MRSLPYYLLAGFLLCEAYPTRASETCPLPQNKEGYLQLARNSADDFARQARKFIQLNDPHQAALPDAPEQSKAILSSLKICLHNFKGQQRAYCDFHGGVFHDIGKVKGLEPQRESDRAFNVKTAGIGFSTLTAALTGFAYGIDSFGGTHLATVMGLISAAGGGGAALLISQKVFNNCLKRYQDMKQIKNLPNHSNDFSEAFYAQLKHNGLDVPSNSGRDIWLAALLSGTPISSEIIQNKKIAKKQSELFLKKLESLELSLTDQDPELSKMIRKLRAELKSESKSAFKAFTPSPVWQNHILQILNIRKEIDELKVKHPQVDQILSQAFFPPDLKNPQARNSFRYADKFSKDIFQATEVSFKAQDLLGIYQAMTDEDHINISVQAAFEAQPLSSPTRIGVIHLEMDFKVNGLSHIIMIPIRFNTTSDRTYEFTSPENQTEWLPKFESAIGPAIGAHKGIQQILHEQAKKAEQRALLSAALSLGAPSSRSLSPCDLSDFKDPPMTGPLAQ